MSMARRKAHDIRATPIDAVRHKDKRKNIPTEELRDFVREDEQAPKTVLYPRDPDLDPQLVWKGKDEDDARPLEVPAVPIYIQEKIHPQAIVEDFRQAAEKAKGPREQQLDFFSDFNGLPEDFSDRVDFYHHEGNWSNRLILGDSLLVMTSLAEKEALKGQVQMIYLDPPYGIKFGSNWQVSTRKRDVSDGKAEDVVRQPEQIKAFRDTWNLGIHSYLAYLRDRLVVARDLLTETGSIFLQIGDENVHLVRSLIDEVFGADNFIAQIAFTKTTGSTRTYIGGSLDYLLFYAKDRTRLKFRSVFAAKRLGEAGSSGYSRIELPSGERRLLQRAQGENETDGRVFTLDNLTSQSMGREKGEGAASWFRVDFCGQGFYPSERSRWKTNESGMARLHLAGRLGFVGNTLRYVRYLEDFAAAPFNDLWQDTTIAGFASDKRYVVETSTKVIERCMLMTTDPGDLVLDPTCGSGTTAYVAEQWGRRWITCDTSRVSLTLARTRLMAGRFPYYLLADSPEGRKKEVELTGVPSPGRDGDGGDIRRGFVYERVPHVTLKSIANNEEIDVIHIRWEGVLTPLLKKLQKIGRTTWRDWWEVPPLPQDDWPEERKVEHEHKYYPDVTDADLDEFLAGMKQWWELRCARQKEIDASIARRADTEILYDRPYEDKKTVRVTGPFTVESLSPHRTISVEEKRERAEVGMPDVGVKVKALGPDDFGRMILENLRTAGVQNTFKGERLKFDTLEPFAGQWIHGRGEYTEAGGKVRRAAVCIGPEHGTVGPELVKEAAKEAVQGVGFDVLIVCGFAFDPHVSEESKRYGKLVVLACRMNPDLAMGDLLKKTGAGNLFMVFGEPDVDVKKTKDGQVTAEIRGLDVYDPTTGEIRSSSTDDIACWFIDTNYNGESFFVRHAYFTGADEPYEKLKRALRAEVDEAAWSALYSTKSRPFPKPETGKIAVKVINHYGDEVLKVYECA
jgi:adenine-specific DNA-methyltransferase